MASKNMAISEDKEYLKFHVHTFKLGLLGVLKLAKATLLLTLFRILLVGIHNLGK